MARPTQTHLRDRAAAAASGARGGRLRRTADIADPDRRRSLALDVSDLPRYSLFDRQESLQDKSWGVLAGNPQRRRTRRALHPHPTQEIVYRGRLLPAREAGTSPVANCDGEKSKALSDDVASARAQPSEALRRTPIAQAHAARVRGSRRQSDRAILPARFFHRRRAAERQGRFEPTAHRSDRRDREKSKAALRIRPRSALAGAVRRSD